MAVTFYTPIITSSEMLQFGLSRQGRFRDMPLIFPCVLSAYLRFVLII